MPDGLSFSVITPSFNQGAFIERTIRSVLDQKLPQLEYLVMDGGSQDGTLAVLERYADRLAYRSERDRGQSDAVNKGIGLTRGELIGWVNSDDTYYPGALQVVRSYFARHPDVDVVYGNADHIDEHDRVLQSYACEPWDEQRLRDVCFLCQPAVFFRRRVVERHGLLDATLDYCMDYEYWIRLAAGGARFAYLPRTLAGSRTHASTKTIRHRVAVHREINSMLKRRLGSVPDRWLANYAHVQVETRGIDRARYPLRTAAMLAALTWAAALRWNRRVPVQLRQTTWQWVRHEYVARHTRPKYPTLRTSRIVGGRRALRIGADVSQTGTRKAGCGYVALGLAQAMAKLGGPDTFLLYPTFGDSFWDPAGPDATWRGEGPNVHRWPGQASPAEARAFWQPRHDLDRALGDPDVVHAHNFFCPRGLTRARLVYTLYDLSFLVNPEWTTEANRLACVSGVFNASIHADFIVASSEATRRHFLEMFPHYPEERTRVVYPASRFISAQPLARPRECKRLSADGFFLTVCTLEPRKNLARLLEAYATYAARTREPMPLVLAGGRGWLMEGFEQQIRSLNLGGHLIRMGYVEDRTLQWLYQNCHSLLYPSLFEGFGLPVVEALSQGAAVLTSRCTSLPEVAGDAAVYVDPTNSIEIADGLCRLAVDEDVRARLRERARDQAAKFSWHAAARQTLDCYHRALEMDKFAGR